MAEDGGGCGYKVGNWLLFFESDVVGAGLEVKKIILVFFSIVIFRKKYRNYFQFCQKKNWRTIPIMFRWDTCSSAKFCNLVWWLLLGEQCQVEPDPEQTGWVPGKSLSWSVSVLVPFFYPDNWTRSPLVCTERELRMYSLGLWLYW